MSKAKRNCIYDHDAVREALVSFAVRACEKLRQRNLVASAAGIFASTDAFDREAIQHHPQRAAKLPGATSDSRLVAATVAQLSRRFLKQGLAYKKAGVWLMDLARPADLQPELFGPATAGNERLMEVVDAINRRHGRGAIGLGATGWQSTPHWGMRQEHLSPRFTTAFSDLPVAYC